MKKNVSFYKMLKDTPVFSYQYTSEQMLQFFPTIIKLFNFINAMSEIRARLVQ